LVETEGTSVKTIRLSKGLERSLEREARNRKMSLNSFVTSILAKYDDWDRLAEKFGMVSLPADELTAILEGLSEAQIEKIARQCGASIPRAVMDFWFSRISAESFLRYLSLRSNYQHFVNHEVIAGNEGQFILTARHEHGKKWSIWCCNYLAEAIRVNFGLEAKFEINGNAYRIECPKLLKTEIRT
jgi:hypothetical protein